MVEETQATTYGHNARGAAFVELLLTLPLLIAMGAFAVSAGALLEELFWVEQTAYNASVYSATLPLLRPASEKRREVTEQVTRLSEVHKGEFHSRLLMFTATAGTAVEVIDPAALPTGSPSIPPEDRSTAVSLRAIMNKLWTHQFGLNVEVRAPSLVPFPRAPTSPEFQGSTTSGGYGTMNCCGFYGGSSPSSCVVSSTYQDSSCLPEDVGKFY